MNIHEYQTKQILKKYGIPTPDFIVISSLDELSQVPWDKAVVKIQVHAGGRGKAGGVKVAKSKEELKGHVKSLLGMKLVNNQTGKEGVVSHRVLISPLVDIEKEYYAACVIDRQSAEGVLIVSSEGGVEIEEVAKTHPEKIFKLPIPLNGKFRKYQLYPLAKALGWKGVQADQGIKIMAALAKAFVETDASLLEVNPLVLTKDGDLTALDAKLSVDENALFRQKELAAMYDPTQNPPNEVKAHQFDLAYIALDGNIGCMVNGAGLAMATMDIIKTCGGRPANFLDVGGGASKEKVAEGFKIILSDPQVKGILVNIFGGIMNCETLAEGIIQAAKETKITVPLVVRMEGTNVEQGKKKLANSGLNIMIAADMLEAAQKVVANGNLGQ